MRIKLTLFLLILNIAVAGFIYYLEIAKKGPQEPDRFVFPPGLAESATYLEMRRADGSSLRFERSPEDGWVVTAPIRWKANGSAVQRLLDHLRFMNWEVEFPVDELEAEETSLADYGLEPPEATLTVGGPNSEYKLNIGQATEFGNRLYVLGQAGDAIRVVSNELLTAIGVGANEARDNSLLTIPIFEAQSLTLDFADEDNKVLVQREAEEGWRLQMPVDARANLRAVEEAIIRLGNAKLREFVLDPLKQPDFQQPLLRVTLEGNGRRQTLLVAKQAEEALEPGEEPPYYARREKWPNSVFLISASVVNNLRGADTTLRERRFIDFVTEAVSSIDISDGDQALTVQKLEEGNQWQVIQKGGEGAGTTYAAEFEAVRDAVLFLARMEAEAFVNDQPTDEEKQRLVLGSLTREIVLKTGNDETINVKLGTVEEDGKIRAYALTSQSDALYRVPASYEYSLPVNILQFRSRSIEKFSNTTPVRSLKITRLVDGLELLDLSINPGRQTWYTMMSDLPDKFEVHERQAVLDLVDFMKDFRVQRYMGEFDPDDFEYEGISFPWAYRLEASLSLPGGDDPAIVNTEYLLSKRLRGSTWYGGSPKHGVNFALHPDLIDALNVLIMDRDIPEPIDEQPSGAAPANPAEPAVAPPEESAEPARVAEEPPEAAVPQE